MKFRDLGKWVGLHGTTLRHRARVLGYKYNLEDSLSILEANKLYRELPVEKVMTISYKEAKKPTIELTGPWNIQDWHRLFKKTQHAIMVRHRDFMREARKNVPELEPETAKIEKVDQPISESQTQTEGVVANESEVVTNIRALVEADTRNTEPVAEEYDHARQDPSTRSRTSTGNCEPTGGTSPEPEPGADSRPEPAADSRPEPVLSGCSEGNAASDDGSKQTPGEFGNPNHPDE